MPGPLLVHTIVDHAALNHAEGEIVFVDEIPHSATGKIQKMERREPFKQFEFKA